MGRLSSEAGSDAPCRIKDFLDRLALHALHSKESMKEAEVDAFK